MNPRILRSYAKVLGGTLGAWLFFEWALRAAIRALIHIGPDMFLVIRSLPVLFTLAQLLLLIFLARQSFEPGSRLKHGGFCFLATILCIHAVRHMGWFQ